MTREIKYFMTQFGYLIEVEFNPCGCCPTSAIVTYSKNNFSKGKKPAPHKKRIPPAVARVLTC